MTINGYHVPHPLPHYRRVGAHNVLTEAVFVVRQLQEKYLAANKRLYMAFVDLEKAFDRVPWKVIW